MSSSISSRDCYLGIKCSVSHYRFMSSDRSRIFLCCLVHFASHHSYCSRLLFCLLFSGSNKSSSFLLLARLATSAAISHSTLSLAKPSKRLLMALSSTVSRSAIILQSARPSSKVEASLFTVASKLKFNLD